MKQDMDVNSLLVLNLFCRTFVGNNNYSINWMAIKFITILKILFAFILH